MRYLAVFLCLLGVFALSNLTEARGLRRSSGCPSCSGGCCQSPTVPTEAPVCPCKGGQCGGSTSTALSAGDVHGPQPHFDARPGPGPGPHLEPHYGGGGFHGFYPPIPLVVNYATQPRYVPNPVTGQMEMHTPGRWTTAADNSVYWQALPIWPLGDAKPSVPAVAGPIKAIISKRPIRAILGRLLRR